VSYRLKGKRTEAYKAYQKAYKKTDKFKAYQKTDRYKAYQKAYYQKNN